MPGGIQHNHKPNYRFVVGDDTLKTWGVWDNQECKWVREELRSSWDALQEAEKLNVNPELVDAD